MKQLNISDHISYVEATKSQTATRHGIDNTPTDQQLKNMRMVAEGCFEPARNYFAMAIGVNSFFRSPEVNRAVGGSGTSQHCADEDKAGIEAAAIDQDCDLMGNNLTNSELFYWQKDNVEFDQLIWEYGDDPSKDGAQPGWVHISKRTHQNRGQVLICYKDANNKTKYKIWGA